MQYILLWQNYWFKSHTIVQYYLKVNPRKMSWYPNKVKLICHESVMMCLFPHWTVYIFQEVVTVYLQVKSALKWEFQEIFTFQMVGQIARALRSISIFTSQLKIYFHHLKIILLIPGSKMRHALENYNHNSHGESSRKPKAANRIQRRPWYLPHLHFGFSFTFKKLWR